MTADERGYSGPLYMLGSALAFSAMTVFVKLAGQRLPSLEIVFMRAIVSLVLSAIGLRMAGVSTWGQARGLLVLRGLLGSFGLICVFYSVTHLPLAEATVIQYLHPTLTALLAAWLLREGLRIPLLWASVLSLSGVALVAGLHQQIFVESPSLLRLPILGLCAAVGGAVLSASAYVCVRKLSATENPLVIVFYFPLVCVPLILPLMLPDFIWPQGIEWLWLAGVGVCTQAGQVWLTRGMQRQSAARATSLSYAQVVFATTWGVLFFGESLTWSTVAGATLVLFGGLIAVRTRAS